MNINNRVGEVVVQHRDGVVRYGVITTQDIKKDEWMYYTVYWISKTNGESDWMHQIEWRCDKVKVIDPDQHIADLQGAMSLRSSRKFQETVS